MDPCTDNDDLTSLVYDYAINGWRYYITDVKRYRKFCDRRGHWILKSHSVTRSNCVLLGSVRRPFDKSVLLWHLATDFCYHKMATTSEGASRLCRKMSNYMAYLLFVNPDMLVPGARSSLLTAAYYEMLLQTKEKDVKTKIIMMMEQKWKNVEIPESATNFVGQAWQIAVELMHLPSNDTWSVIQGVWLEMLCFSASRCRGYLHASSLGNCGGEYITRVWLLLWYMGLESFAMRLQRDISIEEKRDLSGAILMPSDDKTHGRAHEGV